MTNFREKKTFREADSFNSVVQTSYRTYTLINTHQSGREQPEMALNLLLVFALVNY